MLCLVRDKAQKEAAEGMALVFIVSFLCSFGSYKHPMIWDFLPPFNRRCSMLACHFQLISISPGISISILCVYEIIHRKSKSVAIACG